MQSESELRLALDREIKRLLIDCTYSGRGHLVAGARWAWANTFLGLPVAILGALLASGAGLTALVGSDTWLTAALAFASVVLQAAYGFMRPGDRAQAHSLKGNRYIGLRNEARLFREVELRTINEPADLAARLRDLRERYNALSESEPQIPRWAYESAKKGIAQGEADYEDDPLWGRLG